MPKNITKMDRIPLAKKVVVGTSDDAQSSFLQFETVDGPIKVGLRNFELSKLVSLLIGQSEKVALSQLQINPSPDGEIAINTVTPIQASAVGIGKGRTETERVLMVMVGNMKLAFWTDKETISQLSARADSPDLGEPHRTQ